MFSAFNPSKWSSGQPTLQRPGSSLGFGALLKGLTSVMDTSCRSWDSNPQPWVTSGFKSNALTIRPRLPRGQSWPVTSIETSIETFHELPACSVPPSVSVDLSALPVLVCDPAHVILSSFSQRTY